MRALLQPLLLALAVAAAPPSSWPNRVERPIGGAAKVGAFPAPERTEEEKKAEASALFAAWRGDPVRFVREVMGGEPDAWQADVLRALVTEKRIVMSACKGPGKTTALAWCGWWILACHVDAQGFALSITEDNLKDNLWKELALWRSRSPVLTALFEKNSEKIYSKAHPDLWFLSAKSYAQSADKEKQANTLAGLHGAHVFILLDECGDMSPGVIGAASGIFKVVGQRAWVIAAGNPTTEDGALYHAAHIESGRWKVVNISGDPDDPKRSPRIDIDEAREEIRLLGRDNPWVMVNILGLFPPKGANQLIGANAVTLAMARDMPALAYNSEAIVWGLDPSRSEKSGADEAALARRQGLLCRTFTHHTWRGKDGTELGDAIARAIEEARNEAQGPDAVFIDVGGIGASPYDHLVRLGYGDIVHAVDFGGSADDPKYYDKRTEMWVEMALWTNKRPSCLPNDGVLRSELSAPRYWFRRIAKRTCFILESKDDMKKRGVKSPNRADALALTFASPVEPDPDNRGRKRKGRDPSDYAPEMLDSEWDPLAKAA